MHFTEYDTRLAAYGLLTSEDDQVLLTWFNGGAGGEPGWSLPGGGVEFDESIEEAVVREVHEETGYRVQVGPFLVEHHFTAPARGARRPFRSQRFVLAATIIGGELGTVEQGGTTDFATWVRLDEVSELTPRADIIDVAIASLGAERTG